MFGKGMLVYPWDIPDDLEGFVKEYKKLHCNSIVLNASYHHCHVTDLRIRHIYRRREAGISYEPDTSLYGRLKPVMAENRSGLYRELGSICRSEGVSYKCWLVNTHNSTIGDRNPDVCVENAWGDTYTYSLCLNHPDVREYVRALALDAAKAVSPDSFLMEAMTWLPAFHGRHHEFSLPHVTPAIRYLLSLCFCPSCMKAAGEQGIDAYAVKELAAGLLERLLERGTTYGVNEQSQLLHLMLEYPKLYEYQRFRMDSVKRLVRLQTEAVRSQGIRYELITSSTPFEANDIYYEGVSYKDMSSLADTLSPLVYGDAESCAAAVRNIRLSAENVDISPIFNLGRSNCHEADMLGRNVIEALKSGAGSVYYYNYGMASPEMLRWVTEVNCLAEQVEGECHAD